MTYVGVCASFVLYNIKEMNFAFRGSKKEEVANFREKPYNLEAFFVTSYPTEDFLFG